MTYRVLGFVGMVLFLAAGCGGESDADGAAAGAAPPGALTTKSGSYDIVTMDGEKTLTYTIDLPASYECTNPGETPQRWHMKGGRKAPDIRLGPAQRPATLEAAATQSAKGVLGAREVIFKEETDTTIVVVARDPNGEWTQVDGWVKGEGLTPYCWIELYKVPAASEQVDWAKRVAKSLRAGK